jgi:hypothetical protein
LRLQKASLDRLPENGEQAFGGAGRGDEKVDAFLDTLVERLWWEFCKEPRLIRPLDEQ